MTHYQATISDDWTQAPAVEIDGTDFDELVQRALGIVAASLIQADQPVTGETLTFTTVGWDPAASVVTVAAERSDGVVTRISVAPLDNPETSA